MNVDYDIATVAELVHMAESGDEHAQRRLLSLLRSRRTPFEDRELALQSILSLAETGDASIQHSLGNFYRRRGEYAEAARWYRLANAQRPGYARRELVECFLDDPGASETDKASALQWLGDAARSGDDRALEELIDRYHEGRGLPKDPAEEAKWYEVVSSLLRSCPSLPSGESRRGVRPMDPYRIAARMVLREGAPEEVRSTALEWLRHAANEGFEPALRRLHHLCSLEGGELHDAKEAAHWAHVAAQTVDAFQKKSADERDRQPLREMRCDSLARFLIREDDVPAEDRAVALRYLRSKVDGGDRFARRKYAEAVLECESSAADAKEEALQMLREAAEQGDGLSLLTLQHAYRFGHGVPRDAVEAAKWYRLEAEMGDDGAQRDMGDFCVAGEGVPQSYAEAAKWYRLAADQGDAESQFLLGELFAQGLGVERSLARAAEWMRKAFKLPAPEAPADEPALEAEIARLRAFAQKKYWALKKPEA